MSHGKVDASRKIKLIRRSYPLYLMIIPGLAYFILFKYVPMYGISIAFRNFSIFKGYGNAPWAGFDYFIKLFSLPGFIRAFRNTFYLSAAMFVFGFPAPIILSLLINEVNNYRLKKIIQTSVILPNFISWVVIGSLLYSIFSPNAGVVRYVADLLQYKGQVYDLLTSKNTFRAFLVVTYIWKNMGMGTIVYLAAITNVDPQLYEAAEIDGAGKMRRIWHITLSSIRPTIIILLIFRVGNLMNVGFEQIFVMSNSIVNEVSEVLDTYVYKVGMLQQQYSLATAAGLFKAVICLTLVILTNKLSNRIEPESGIM
jgi:putative aldouronate transport system permease protein